MCISHFAAWIRYLGGYDEQKKQIQLQDSLAVEHRLDRLVGRDVLDIKQILDVSQVFGDSGKNQQFTDDIERLVELFYEIRSKETLKKWINDASNSEKIKYLKMFPSYYTL